MVYDAIVLGLGPGGAVAAYEMAKHGMTVLALEKAMLPRYKACGGCVATKAARILDFPIDPVVEQTVYGAIFTYRGRSKVEIISDQPIGYMTMRDRFDALLAEKAGAAGAVIRDGEAAREIERSNGTVTVRTTKAEYKCRVLVGADGVNSLAAKTMGVSVKKAVALEVEAKVDPAVASAMGKAARIDFGAVPGGYGWVFPKKEVLSFGIGGLRSKGEDFRKHLMAYARTEKSLAGIGVEKIHGHLIPAFEGSLPRLSDDRMLLIGDAGGLVDPFLGEGIYYAARSGQMAAEAVRSFLNNGMELSSYDEAVRNEIYPELDAALVVSRFAFSHPWLWHQIMRTYRELLLSFYDVIRGDDRYDRFLARMRERVRIFPRPG